MISKKVTFSARFYPNNNYYNGTTITGNDSGRTFKIYYDTGSLYFDYK